MELQTEEVEEVGLTEEDKQAENDRLDALQAKQEKNKRRGRKPKAKIPEGLRQVTGKDLMEVVCLKRIALDGFDMSNVGEHVLLPRDVARLQNESGGVRVVI